ncbi:Protein FAR1-RELATED SEQUENCE 6, partial [Linum grandiflorum]
NFIMFQEGGLNDGDNNVQSMKRSESDTITQNWIPKIECMGTPPAAIITDQCRSMGNAIEKVFPNARHRWCIWHILSKVPYKLGSHSRYDELRDVLKRTSLKQFLEQYQIALKGKIEKEKIADSRSYVASIQCATSVEYEEQFQKIYTNEKFKVVQKELTDTLYCFERVGDIDGDKTTYIVQYRPRVSCDQLRKREFTVIHDQESGDVACNCGMFEFEGILCYHIFRILMRNGVQVIDSKYILKRWRKDISKGHSKIKVGYVGEVSTRDMERFTKLEKRFNELANLSCEYDGKYQYVEKLFDEAHKALVEWKDELPNRVESVDATQEATYDTSRDHTSLVDPIVAQTRGRPKSKRIPSSFEANNKRSRGRACKGANERSVIETHQAISSFGTANCHLTPPSAQPSDQQVNLYGGGSLTELLAWMHSGRNSDLLARMHSG